MAPPRAGRGAAATVFAIALGLAGACEPDPVREVPRRPDIPGLAPRKQPPRPARRRLGDEPPPPAPAAAPAPAPGVPAPEAPPPGPDRAQANRIWDEQAVPRFSTCFESAGAPPGSVDARFRIHPSGRVLSPEVSGGDPAVARCIRGTLDGLRFPAFEGETQEISRPIEYQRVPAPR